MIELTKAQIDRFADYKAGYLPSETGSGPAFRTSIGQSVNSIVRLAETDSCLKRKEFFKSTLDLDEFRERVLLVDGARVVIGGIRFRNLNPGFPFVEATANFFLLEPIVMQHVASIAAQQFAGFAPRGLLVVGPPAVALPTGLERWTHVVSGPSALACGRALPSGLLCSFPETVDFDDAYRVAYAEWQASDPALGVFVRVEPRRNLEEAAAAGLLASFHDQIGWCGVVAAREEALYGTRAIQIIEIFLLERWRGRGAAKAIDAALVAKVAERHALIWEHIHSENWPSLRTARAQGRSIIETEYFLPFRT